MGAHDIQSHVHVKQEMRQTLEPGGVHGNGAGCFL